MARGRGRRAPARRAVRAQRGRDLRPAHLAARRAAAAEAQNDDNPEIILSEKEQNIILLFFDENIRGQESTKVVKIFRFLLKDINNE